MTALAFWLLAAFGAAYIAGHSKISLWPRQWFALMVSEKPVELIECPACFGTWLGFIGGAFLPVTLTGGLLQPEYFTGAFPLTKIALLGALLVGAATAGSNYLLARLTGLVRPEEPDYPESWEQQFPSPPENLSFEGIRLPDEHSPEFTTNLEKAGELGAELMATSEYGELVELHRASVESDVALRQMARSPDGVVPDLRGTINERKWQELGFPPGPTPEEHLEKQLAEYGDEDDAGDEEDDGKEATYFKCVHRETGNLSFMAAHHLESVHQYYSPESWNITEEKPQ